MSESQSRSSLALVGLATSLPIMTVAGAFLGYYIALSTGSEGFTTIGVIGGAFVGFLLSLVELWSYTRSQAKQRKNNTDY
jgi:hypothetical protein